VVAPRPDAGREGRFAVLAAGVDRWGDTALALVLVALAFAPGVSGLGTEIADRVLRAPDALGVVLILAQALPLALRRRVPATCLAVVGGAFAVHQVLGYPTTVASLGLVVAVYSAGAHVRRRTGIVTAVAAVAVYVLLAVALHDTGSPNGVADFVAFGVLGAAFAAGGVAVRRRGERAADERRRAEAEVVTAERARIARELHDVITHHVTAMVVQADAAAYVAGADPAAETFSTIGTTGRAALTDLRAMLGALQEPPSTTREPALGELADLVATARAAGQPVDLVEEGTAEGLGDAAAAALHRVVQEGLTNALKHAAGARTVVRVRQGSDAVDVSIVSAPAERPGLGRGSGRGLVGLRERVGLVGGELETDRGPDGGFVLRARIPRGDG
jgi:signal transduction histidine kinase